MGRFNRESTVAHLERLYGSRDVVRQRRAVLDVARLRSGHRVADIGAGPGFLALDAARLVGTGGRVVAVDRSRRMLTSAAARAAEASVDLDTLQADATGLPFADGSFDVVFSTQVLEYVPDVEKALAEMARVLRPGGRVCILDTDWRSCIWETRDRDSTDRLLHAWRDHFVHPGLPRRLRSLLIKAGFEVDEFGAVPIVNTSLAPDAYSTGMLPVVCRFLRDHEEVDAAAVDRFEADLRELDAQGRYFFSVCRFLVSAVAP